MATPAESVECPKCGAPLADGGWCLSCAGGEIESALFGDGSRAAAGREPQAGEKPEIAGWEIERLLGMGGMGELWLATGEDGRAVIKLPTPSAGDPREILERFETEAQILAGLEHENVLRVLDAGTAADGRLFLATEFVEGSDLRRLLRKGRLPAERAVEIFFKVCDAVGYAHGEGVVHRDLKPSNILVGEDGALKVADFGLAKDLSGLSSDGRTSEGDGLGTPYYLAPESMRSASDSDERADVYSLGVLLYELLTGKVPLGQYTPISERCDFGKGWDKALGEALNDEPEQRMASVTALREEVASLWSSERSGKGQGMRWGWLGAVGLVAACVLAVVFWPEAEDESRNSVGMRMLPVADEGVLMAECETTYAQFEEFLTIEQGDVPPWRRRGGVQSEPGLAVLTESGWVPDLEGYPRAPGYDVTDGHPVVGITARDALMFCQWLTEKEQAAGRISAMQRYRLPTVREWFVAAKGEVRSEGNYARGEAAVSGWPADRAVSEGSDEFPRSAPVEEASANPAGFRAMGGNVAEWVLLARELDDPMRAQTHWLGYSWADPQPSEDEGPRAQHSPTIGLRRSDVGFRVVLELGDERKSD